MTASSPAVIGHPAVIDENRLRSLAARGLHAAAIAAELNCLISSIHRLARRCRVKISPAPKGPTPKVVKPSAAKPGLVIEVRTRPKLPNRHYHPIWAEGEAA